MEEKDVLEQRIVELAVRMVLDVIVPDVRGWENFKNESFFSRVCEWKIGTDWNDNLQAECWLIRPSGRELAYSTIPNAASSHPHNVRCVYECLPVFFEGIAKLYPNFRRYWHPLILVGDNQF